MNRSNTTHTSFTITIRSLLKPITMLSSCFIELLTLCKNCLFNGNMHFGLKVLVFNIYSFPFLTLSSLELCITHAYPPKSIGYHPFFFFFLLSVTFVCTYLAAIVVIRKCDSFDRISIKKKKPRKHVQLRFGSMLSCESLIVK